MNPGFIVTSAINTKFGVYTAEQRLEQTHATLDSIYSILPDAVVVLVEMAGKSMPPEYKTSLQDRVDVIIDFSNDAQVKEIYQTWNWDIAKNQTEIMCFRRALEILAKLPDESKISKVSRFFKLSGRYELTDRFDPAMFDESYFDDKYVFATAKPSTFPSNVTGDVPYQLMSRLWSFPAGSPAHLHRIIRMYRAMERTFATIVRDGGYIDIEHLLYLFVRDRIRVELNVIGVSGSLGPNGTRVED